MGFVLEVAYHNDVPVQLLRTEADIDRFVAELLTADPFYRSASVYAIDEATNADPDHEMIIAADPDRGIGAVRYSGGDVIPGDDAEEWFSVGERPEPSGTVAYSYFGTGHDWPDNSDVPLDVVRRAMTELLVSGGKRPGGVAWQGRG